MPSVDGLISGLDTSSIISQLMDVARAPIRAMQSNISRIEARRTSMQEMNTLMSDLQTALAAVDTGGEFGAGSITSSQPDALGATLTGEVTPGSHSVRVYNLAESTIKRSNGFDSPDETMRRGNLRITTSAGVTDVPIQSAEGTRTLNGLAAYINENVEGVNAYVLDDGTGSEQYRLMIEGAETGAANEVSTSISYQGGGKRLTLSTARSARDARLLVDNTTVYRDNNNPTDVLPGVQLDLKNVTSGNALITVGRDPAAMAEKVEGVVEAYNKLNDFIRKQSESENPGPLAGDATVRTVQRRIQSMMSGNYGNLELSGLGALGLGTTQTGALEFDSSLFTTKAGQSYGATLDVLTGPGGLFGAMHDQLDLITDTSTGLIQSRLDSFDEQITDLNDRIDDSSFRLEQYEETLRSQFLQMESLLLTYQSTGDYLAAQLSSLGTNNN